MQEIDAEVKSEMSKHTMKVIDEIIEEDVEEGSDKKEDGPTLIEEVKINVPEEEKKQESKSPIATPRGSIA